MRQYRRFLKLFFNKAYIWQYLEAGGELDDFYEAKEAVRGLIDSYEELLTRAVHVEDPTSKLKLEVKGKTTPIVSAEDSIMRADVPGEREEQGLGDGAAGG